MHRNLKWWLSGRVLSSGALPTALPTTLNEGEFDLRFYKPSNDPVMLVEFSVAAYRFGHSMERPIYRLNTTLADRQAIFSLDPQGSQPDGFQKFPSDWAIDWTLFFDFGVKGQPALSLSKERIQHA